jgi:hypothetical protein
LATLVSISINSRRAGGVNRSVKKGPQRVGHRPNGSALLGERPGTFEHDLAILDPQSIIQQGKDHLLFGRGQRCAGAHQLDHQDDSGEADVAHALQGRTDDIEQGHA